MIATDLSAGGFLVLIQDDAQYDLSADATLPAGIATDPNVYAGTRNQNGSDFNAGMPVIDFGAGAYDLFMGNHVWVENIKSQNNSGTGNELFSHPNNGHAITYKCWAHNGQNGFGGGNGMKAAFCRATSCSVGFAAGGGGWVTHCFAASCSNYGYDISTHNTVINCIATDCTSEGFRTQNSGILLENCTSDGNDNALETEANDVVVALFSHFTNSTTTGVLQNASNDATTYLIGCNFSDNGTDKTGTNLISVDETTTDPSYADADNVDFTPSAAAVLNLEKGSVHDDAAPTADEGLNGRSSFIDVGAIQIDHSGGGGGGGLLVHPGTSGGARG